MKDAEVVTGLPRGGGNFVCVGRYSLQAPPHGVERRRAFKIVIRDEKGCGVAQHWERRLSMLGGFNLEINSRCTRCRSVLEMRNLLLDGTCEPAVVLLMTASSEDVRIGIALPEVADQ